ncbi:hypothetical protein EZS27_022822 [termite gut metagenome]|uniref:Uncharacterized protein n=1 Tax=termite gut metagenome TaxID=433724 RepID=A0A5J4R410_9ZZZZ
MTKIKIMSILEQNESSLRRIHRFMADYKLNTDLIA